MRPWLRTAAAFVALAFVALGAFPCPCPAGPASAGAEHDCCAPATSAALSADHGCCREHGVPGDVLRDAFAPPLAVLAAAVLPIPALGPVVPGVTPPTAAISPPPPHPILRL